MVDGLCYLFTQDSAPICDPLSGQYQDPYRVDHDGRVIIQRDQEVEAVGQFHIGLGRRVAVGNRDL